MVLLEGTVEVLKKGSEPLATIDAPTVLGEISLLTEGPHTATVRAKTACEFSLLTTTQFHRLLREESLAAYKVIAILAEVLARRLTRMDEKFVEVSRQTPSAHVEELTAFKEKLFTEWSF
jgi:CRP-like cAMP-binding protein